MNDDPRSVSPSAVSPLESRIGDVGEAGADASGEGEPLIAPATEPMLDSADVPVVRPGTVAAETEAEDAQPRTTRPSPRLPSAFEFKAHKITHIPYRSWCDECVECFGREWGHSGDAQVEGRSVPVISMDYLFVTPKGVVSRDELPEDEATTVLKVVVVFDSTTKCIFAHGIPKKGAEPYTVQCVVDDIAWLGHCRVVIRADNEPAMLALVLEALRGLRVEGLSSVATEGSVPYDPQTNGAAEVAVQLTKKQMRATLLTLQKQLQAEITPTHPVVAWMVAHSAN